MSSYNSATIEKKWQQSWAEKELYRTPDTVKDQENVMLLTEFPYPSGNLHMGHWYAYAVPDMHARYLRMRGYNVLYPVGFDAFGLPAENAAIKRNSNPKEWTEQNIATMTEQMHSMGTSFDWSRAIATTDPAYYRWTQWMFIRMFEKGLAYRAQTTVNWCPVDKTVLANEQVVDGKCERDGADVEQKVLEQWMLKTTEYAQELVDDIEDLDWPHATKAAQKNWIGRSDGAEITFALNVPGQEAGKHTATVFTTRPDTLFGCTFLVISPELAQQWLDVDWEAHDDVRAYITEALSRRELERMEREKTGVDTGVKAVNPINGEEVPVWVADYVLGSYGTGAIMAVPGHDERDREFARTFGLPVRIVILPRGLEAVYAPEGVPDKTDPSYKQKVAVIEERLKETATAMEGTLINSDMYDDLASDVARRTITKDLASRGIAEEKTTYRLRDWVLSRQRYWGCPIPIVKCESCGYVPVPDDELPVILPPLDDFKPSDDGRSPLAKDADFVNTTCPKCNESAERETDTMDTFVDSSWYFLRYTDPTNERRFADEKKIKEWMPIPMYVGGAEHNTMHLLYSRFWTRALHHMGYVDFAEPFLGRRNHGIILGPDGQKMSKSRGNVVDPDDLVKQYGADTVRMYLAFMAPYEQGGPWDPGSISGTHRFLRRFYEYVISHAEHDAKASDEVIRAVHSAVKEIGEDLASGQYNTAVSWAMKMLNALEKEEGISRELLRSVIMILAPMAPHITEELWHEVLGEKESVHVQAWPGYDSAVLERDVIELPVQINGKMRGTVSAGKEDTDKKLVERVHEIEAFQSYLTGKNIKKVVHVHGRILNIVTD